MAVTKQQYDKLKSSENSWALWDNKFPTKGCICETPDRIEPDLLRPNLHIFNNSVVFLGLNRSKSLVADYQSFHFPNASSKDGILKKFIQDGGLSGLFGGFMTDLLDIKESDSSKAIKMFEDEDKKTNGNLSKKIVERLFEKISILCPPEKEISIICFGDTCFDILSKLINITKKQIKLLPNNIKEAVYVDQDLCVNIYQVWHYSNWGKYQAKLEELQNQLSYLNKIV